MKKFFTLIAAAMMVVGANAQKEWNFSNWEAKDYANETIEDLTVYSGTDATGKAAVVTIDANNKTIDGVKYTQRLKLGGAGSFSEAGEPVSRILAFNVTGNAKIEVALTTSNKTDNRVLHVDAAANGTKTEVQLVNCTANEAVTKTIDYTGGAATIYLYSESGGINIYDIKYTPTGDTNGINNINVAPTANENAPVYNLAGQRVNKEAKGILIQNGRKVIK